MKGYPNYALLAFAPQLAERLRGNCIRPEDIVLDEEGISLFGGAYRITFLGTGEKPNSAKYMRALDTETQMRIARNVLVPAFSPNCSASNTLLSFEFKGREATDLKRNCKSY